MYPKEYTLTESIAESDSTAASDQEICEELDDRQWR